MKQRQMHWGQEGVGAHSKWGCLVSPHSSPQGVSLRASAQETEEGLQPLGSQAKALPAALSMVCEVARRTEARTRGCWAGDETPAPSTGADAQLPGWGGGGVSALTWLSSLGLWATSSPN